mmetsp:Transcript_4181/g.11309  ORF Transcript_4181/g.11309 Transcript_4181/m.11309 type:complete len:81 (-) Transcript_4181:385-627(-)
MRVPHNTITSHTAFMNQQNDRSLPHDQKHTDLLTWITGAPQGLHRYLRCSCMHADINECTLISHTHARAHTQLVATVSKH